MKENKETRKKLTCFSVLKIVILGIILSLCDVFTDFLQGVNLIKDFQGIFEEKKEAILYGIVVLVICWVPGFLNIIHLWSNQKKNLCYLFGFLIVYPIVPTVCYLGILFELVNVAVGIKQLFKLFTALDMFDGVKH